MRLFVAVEVPHSKVFQETFDNLAMYGKKVKPVDPRNHHITLKFIGDPACSMERVIESLGSVEDLLKRSHLKLDEVGAFPGWKRPSVIWVGSSENDTFSTMANIIDRNLHENIGTPLETRSFRAHLTLARIKGVVDIEPLRSVMNSTLKKLTSDEFTIPVNSIKLINSTLTPDGPRYETLFSLDLDGKDPHC